ncbi:hypothetical protein J2853_001024 [Streptosporangium lutulentum]|uniref:Uncharacterized protein n=1 Tax=Streptosporangium lutulentum TaxID=1461250 RepID=A0ABT9Q535_9ACTN|nr:hypothetical protein [Streptosporangium lutulentum]
MLLTMYGGWNHVCRQVTPPIPESVEASLEVIDSMPSRVSRSHLDPSRTNLRANITHSGPQGKPFVLRITGMRSAESLGVREFPSVPPHLRVSATAVTTLLVPAFPLPPMTSGRAITRGNSRRRRPDARHRPRDAPVRHPKRTAEERWTLVAQSGESRFFHGRDPGNPLEVTKVQSPLGVIRKARHRRDLDPVSPDAKNPPRERPFLVRQEREAFINDAKTPEFDLEKLTRWPGCSTRRVYHARRRKEGLEFYTRGRDERAVDGRFTAAHSDAKIKE